MLAEVEGCPRAANANFRNRRFQRTVAGRLDRGRVQGRPLPGRCKVADRGRRLAGRFCRCVQGSASRSTKAPGYTWTPTTNDNDPNDHHDRIDFVLVSGREALITKAEIVGKRLENADIAVAPYPSDHRGVVATVTLK